MNRQEAAWIVASGLPQARVSPVLNMVKAHNTLTQHVNPAMFKINGFCNFVRQSW